MIEGVTTSFALGPVDERRGAKERLIFCGILVKGWLWLPEGTKAEQMQLFNYLCLGRAGFFLSQGISAAFFSPSRCFLYYQLHLRLNRKPTGAGSCPPCMEDLFPEQDKLAWSGSFTPPETTSPCGAGQ